jgi:hypothetical protein
MVPRRREIRLLLPDDQRQHRRCPTHRIYTYLTHTLVSRPQVACYEEWLSLSLSHTHTLFLFLFHSPSPPPHTHADSYSLSHPLTHPVSHPQVECYEEWLTAASRLVPLWDMDTIRQVLSFGNVILYNVLIKWFL